MRQASLRSRSLPGAVGAASPAIPSARIRELGGSVECAFPNPFLDDFEEVVAGTKYKASNVPNAVSNSVGQKYDVQRVSAEGAKSHE
jgi:hypothetical protein